MFTPEIHHKTFIRCAPERVFETLTSAEGWDAWFTRGTQLDLKNKRIYLRWENFGADGITAQDGGRIVDFIPDEKFSFEWQPGESVTTVEFLLEPRDSGTLLAVRETGYTLSTRDTMACLDCASGWGEALTLLKFYLEHGIRY